MSESETWTREIAEGEGYKFKRLVLEHASSWHVFLPGKKYLGVVKSIKAGVELCEKHYEKTH